MFVTALLHFKVTVDVTTFEMYNFPMIEFVWPIGVYCSIYYVKLSLQEGIDNL